MAIDRGHGIVTPAVLADSYDLDGILAKYEEFDNLYLGTLSADPTTDNDGNPLKSGALYFNSVTSRLSVYNGTQWESIGSTTLEVNNFTGNGSTVVYGLSLAPNDENATQVYIDGVYQQKNTYSTSSKNLTFSEAPPNLSDIEVMIITSFDIGETDAGSVTYDQGGTGSVARTVQDKLQESVSVKDFGAVGDGTTDDTSAIQSAVTYCNTNATSLSWPKGTFLTVSSISDLHNVKHIGDGVIKRGSDLFYIDAVESQDNTLYVTTTGNINNDGLSSTEATTIQRAFDILKNYGPVLEGIWTVDIASGTYNQANSGFGCILKDVKSINRVVIKGATTAGHPAVPTTIYDGTGGTNYEHGIRVAGIGLRVSVKDIKFTNFTSNNTRIGLVGEQEVDFHSSNIHADNCDWCGVYAFNVVRARVYGGILNNCRSGFITNSSQTTLYGDNGNPIIVSNCTESGVYWSRGSQGHSDYVKFEDNAVGLIIAENSRVDTILNEFYRNSYGLRAQTGGVFGEGGSANVFGTGADANTILDLDFKAFSGDTSTLRFAESSTRFGYDRTTYNHSGTGDTIISTPYELEANRMLGSGKTTKVRTFGAFTSATAGSLVNIRFGGMTLSLAVPTVQTNTTFIVTAELHEVQGGYRAFGLIETGLNGQRTGQASSGFDKAIANDVSIGANLAGAGDSMSIYRTDVEITG